MNGLHLNSLISFHYTLAASASSEMGRKDCPFYASLPLFLSCKYSLCFNCPKICMPRCPVLIRFLFSLWLLHRFPPLLSCPPPSPQPICLNRSTPLRSLHNYCSWYISSHVCAKQILNWMGRTPHVMLKGDTFNITHNMSS